MEWFAENWGVLAGMGSVCFLAGTNIGMLWQHGKILDHVRREATTLNGTVGEIKGSLMSCQEVQRLMLAGRIKDSKE